MSDAAEQGVNAPEPTHSPSDWAAKLRESSKVAPQEDKRPETPQEEEVKSTEVDETEEDEAPTSNEVQDTTDEEELETEALDTEEDAEPSDTELKSVSIAADDVYLVDGEEVDGQTLLNGIAATKNFAQEKHRLREEAATQLQTETAELHSRRDEYAQATTFMMQKNQQAFHQVEQQLNTTQDPQEFQKLRQQLAGMQQAEQQLKGQFDQFLTNVQGEEKAKKDKAAADSLAILRDQYGQDEWRKMYPDLQSTASDYGFKSQEFLGWTDHRMMNLIGDLNKAKAKISDMESVATKKRSNTVTEKNKRNSQRVNTSLNRKAGDALDTARKSHKPKDYAGAWLEANSKKRSR